MPNVSASEVRILEARRQHGVKPAPVPEGWQRPGPALQVFMPGVPTHYKGKGHRMTVARHTQRWRESTATHLLLYARPHFARPRTWPWMAHQPKLCTFTVYCRRAFDDDNLALVCSGVRDALKDMRLISDDSSRAGHTFTYAQVVDRDLSAPMGIAVCVQASA